MAVSALFYQGEGRQALRGAQTPAGVYAAGLAFLLRDTVQRFAGNRLALCCVVAGTGMSVFVSTTLALASASAFAASEVTALVVFAAFGGRTAGSARLAVAVGIASLAGAALDSYVFLRIAFGSLAFFDGQFVAKLSVLVLAVPFVLSARRRWPAPEVAVA